MENLNQLIGLYASDKRIEEVVQTLKGITSGDFLCKGLRGAQASFVLEAIHALSNRNQLYIANDKESAAYFQNNLLTLFGKKPVWFFPDSFKRPTYFEELNANNALQRTEIINRITSTHDVGQIIVTYPEALFEQVVSPEAIKKTKIHIQTGEDMDVDFLIDMLLEYGFKRVDFVYEPGQYSIRGGIFDIFSYGNEWPYRVELFDDEVESIRTFDPTTQLSKQNISKISIVPNVNTRFTQADKTSLFEVLDLNTLIWVQDMQFVIDKLQACFEKAEIFATTIRQHTEEELTEIFKDRAFVKPADLISAIQERNILYIGPKPLKTKIDKTFDFGGNPQPSFNRNFQLLIDNLKEHESKGIKNYLFTENPRQIERFYAIFEDLGAKVIFHPVLGSLHEGFIDPTLKIACYTDHQIFERFHKYKLKRGFTKDQALNLRMVRELTPGDFVTHIDYGVGRYSGLEKIVIAGRAQESVRLIYQNNDVLYVGINSLHKISKYVGKDGTAPRLNKLGSDTWKAMKRKAKKKVKDIAAELIKLYAKRKASEGHAFEADGYLQNELEASFIYEDTPDQYKATVEVKEDMEKGYPMDRLICGDVGFGKTEIAVRAAFKSVINGKQVAILVPTTILALQHQKTFKERLGNFGVEVDYINRFRTTKEKGQIFQRLKEGKLDIVIGTHGLLNKDVGFKDLGLLIIDEEQKFGVAAKEKLRNLKVNVDTLTLTATPIPRTLQFSLMAARDLSIIRTAPPNRQPIYTEIRVFNPELIKDSIYYEINRGGQVFFVHNRVKTLPEVTEMIKRICPDIEIGMAHGQMESRNLERALIDFIDYKYDVLVCTNIIETGLDIPNANTIIINNAHQFGMSDLHQLRGRVGRSNKKAFCYLFCPPMSTLTTEARKRLKTIEEFSDLGSGFNIAMRDLDIRGAGNLLGGEQSGFISDIGYETYQKILEEAIQELKEKEFKALFAEEMTEKREYVKDVQIETDVEMLIPDDYVSVIQERLNLYTVLDSLEDEKQLEQFVKQLEDRFGKVPVQVYELCNGLRLRWICKLLAFEKVVLKNNKLICFFIENPQSSFYETAFFQKILKYVSIHGPKKKIRFKQTPRHFMVIYEGLGSLKEARQKLDKMYAEIIEVDVELAG